MEVCLLGFLIQKDGFGKHEPLSSLHPAWSTNMKPRSTRAILGHEEDSHLFWVVQWKDSRSLDRDGMPGGAAVLALDFLIHEDKYHLS